MPQHEPTLGDEKNDRLEIIRTMIWQGMSRADIVNEIQDNPDKFPWQLSGRQIRNYYKECWEGFGKDAVNIDRSAWFTVVLRRYDEDYSAAKKAGNLKEARENNTAISHLLHLDKPAYDLDWRKAMKEAGLDPDTAIEQFAAMFNKDADEGATD